METLAPKPSKWERRIGIWCLFNIPSFFVTLITEAYWNWMPEPETLTFAVWFVFGCILPLMYLVAGEGGEF